MAPKIKVSQEKSKKKSPKILTEKPKRKFCLRSFLLRLLGVKSKFNSIHIEYAGVIHLDDNGIGLVLEHDVNIKPNTHERVKLDSCIKINGMGIEDWRRSYAIHQMKFLQNQLIELKEVDMFYGTRKATCFLHNNGIYDTAYLEGSRIAYIDIDINDYDEIIINPLD
jgi:hypothetical protein